MLHIPGLFIAETEDRGRGVFTSEELSVDDIVEVCPIIIIPEKDFAKIHESVLHDYYFNWETEDQKLLAIALGYGSLYNHSSEPNLTFILDFDQNQIVFKALKEIESGDELLINYEEGLKGKSVLWF